ncbi:hypothetical protein LZ32DRAFT_49208 [Colletotrichum eremochloae]|nr:hypothetical protein LZ32DRAFT_49208 [Colletotrichum eremochloae]
MGILLMQSQYFTLQLNDWLRLFRVRIRIGDPSRRVHVCAKPVTQLVTACSTKLCNSINYRHWPIATDIWRTPEPSDGQCWLPLLPLPFFFFCFLHRGPLGYGGCISASGSGLSLRHFDREINPLGKWKTEIEGCTGTVVTVDTGNLTWQPRRLLLPPVVRPLFLLDTF